MAGGLYREFWFNLLVLDMVAFVVNALGVCACDSMVTII